MIVPREELMQRREAWRREGHTVVLTNGVFDLLHYGHITYLEAARRLGDLLIVGLNSDISVQTIRGPLRPLVPQDQRAGVLAALRCVDYVTIFDEPTAEALVAALQPDVYVKGGDYTIAEGDAGKPLPEAQIVRGYGGRVELIRYLPGLSTTALIERIIERYR
ncbi:MAG: ADP-heptose synthase [Herpetosiphonaceae bacterium]|nr:MAG: ADP-heptose synthase [Herpetosiphonaceae bacterium]